MADIGRLFARALEDHDPRLLRDAFERCNQREDLVPYDRTAFGRWLKGDLPSRREFVLAFSEELQDTRIYDAWLEARGDTTDVAVKRVVTSFVRLNPDEQREAARQIEEHMARRQSSIREQFSMRIELEDWPGEAGFLRARVTLIWLGELPGDAKVMLLSGFGELAGAYDRNDCLFRDALVVPAERGVDDILKLCSAELTYYDADDPGSRSDTRYGTAIEPGVLGFANHRLRKANIELQVTYPYPRGHGKFPILFRGYQIRGRTRIRFAPRAACMQDPQSYAFLGQRDAFTTETTPQGEMIVTAGLEHGILRAETGLVFTWSEGAI